MQHSYDLVLQPQPSDALALEPLVAALNARTITVSAEGKGTWKFGGDEVVFSPLMEAGALKGLDVRVPFHDKTDMLETVVKELLEVAGPLNLRLSDPQRGDVATLTSLSAVVDEYLRMARYAGEYGGVSAALGLSKYSVQPEGDGTSFRWLMALLVFFVALYVGWRTLSTIQAAKTLEREQAEQQQYEKDLKADPRRQ